MFMYTVWRGLIKDCLLDPKDQKEDNALDIFKILYKNTSDINPGYALICAKEAITLACREKNSHDTLSDFHINIMTFKTNTVRFVKEQLGDPIPK